MPRDMFKFQGPESFAFESPQQVPAIRSNPQSIQPVTPGNIGSPQREVRPGVGMLPTQTPTVLSSMFSGGINDLLQGATQQGVDPTAARNALLAVLFSQLTN